MLSVTRQCTELFQLMLAIQKCFDREGSPIPCRAEDLAVYLERARDQVGVDRRVQR